MSGQKNSSWDPASLLKKVLVEKIAANCPQHPGKSRRAEEHYLDYVESTAGRFLDLVDETLSGNDKAADFEGLGKEQGRLGADHNWKLKLVLWPFLAVRDELRQHIEGTTETDHTLEQLLQSTDLTMVAASQALLDDKVKVYQARERRLSRLAATDELTQLPNRRRWGSQLKAELDRAKRHSRDLSIARIDLDNFKVYNDTYGHESGDSLLRHVTETFKQGTRRSDFLSRFGGDEFAVYFPEAAPTSAVQVVERIRTLVEESKWQDLTITVSIGVSGYPLHGETYQELMLQADAALYTSKQAGGNQTTMAQTEEDQRVAQERRQHPRHDVTWVAQVFVETNKIGKTLATYPVQIANASLGGFLITLGQHLMPRTPVKVDLAFPQIDRTLSASGRVVWSRLGEQAIAGIQLTSLKEPDRNLLQNHIGA